MSEQWGEIIMSTVNVVGQKISWDNWAHMILHILNDKKAPFSWLNDHGKDSTLSIGISFNCIKNQCFWCWFASIYSGCPICSNNHSHSENSFKKVAYKNIYFSSFFCKDLVTWLS